MSKVGKKIVEGLQEFTETLKIKPYTLLNIPCDFVDGHIDAVLRRIPHTLTDQQVSWFHAYCHHVFVNLYSIGWTLTDFHQCGEAWMLYFFKVYLKNVENFQQTNNWR